ncbi:MAG: hypothetical protein A2Z21_05650 [Candidatus Fraserbacteria bacterium RBG_16_55_9]|uniref:Uncharacterized protein n=1 Tax=Fraserbacteria sp. (strain RBG_16_55_9) TaxID=1817864 RepID=A0A1F5UPL7_FRAXR|nr:MAG: hypothetical protein A2Z21_05650 [Candidatus Fraserbacteria bacterium RBG_16_55_9]
MESIWSLNAFLIFTGLSFEIASAWLLLSANRVESPGILIRFAVVLLLVAIPLQIIGLLVPELRIASYWFVLGALPLLLPAPLLYQARQSQPTATRSQSAISPAVDVSTGDAQKDFHEQLMRIPAVLTKHPRGLTLVEIGRAMSVDWRRLTGATNELLRLNRIRKEGKRYFNQSRK